MSIVAKVLPILDEGKGSAQGSRGGGGDEAGLDESRMQELRSLKPEGQGSDKAKECALGCNRKARKLGPGVLIRNRASAFLPSVLGCNRARDQ
eukprot:scaffold142208_cov18-Tisochrysis_lutea.AAC.1